MEKKVRLEKKLDYVDAMRGIAILLVLMVHTGQYGRQDFPDFMKTILINSTSGVQLFFIASAFTLFLSSENRENEPHANRNFFIRRFFRIAPMYYIGIIYYLCQDGLGARYWLGDADHVSAANIIANFLFLHGLSPYWINSVVPGGWSIAVEMIFYLTLPFLFSRIKNINQAFNLFLISNAVQMVLFLLLFNQPVIGSGLLWGHFLDFWFFSQLPVFSLGIVMYFIIIKNESLADISGRSLLIFCGFLLCELFSEKLSFMPAHVQFGLGFVILGIALGKYKWPVIVNPVIINIGKISFSMYLVHFAVLHWLAHFHFIDYAGQSLLNYCIRYLLVLVITVLISAVTYNAIEVPFQKLGKKLIKKETVSSLQ